MSTAAIKITDLDILAFNDEEESLELNDINSSSSEQICIKMIDYLLF